jgi:DNA-binding GntR family transcriptional regulator
MDKSLLPKVRARRPVSDLEYVFTELKRSLMMGEFEPEQKLPLPVLADLFGTSQMPIREAANRLVVARALEASPRRSLFVPAASVERLDSLLPIRLMLEGQATRLAVQLGDRNLPTELRAINKRMDAGVHSDNAESYLQLNHKFHFAIYRRCGNDHLIDMIELLWMRYGPLMSKVRAGEFSERGHIHHSGVIEGVVAGDAEKAAEAMRNDIADAAVRIRNAILKSSTAAKPKVA